MIGGGRVRSRSAMKGSTPSRGHARWQRGFVSVELALALPAVILVLGLCLAVVMVAMARIAAIDSARAGAREAAIGGTEAQVFAVVQSVAGQDAIATLHIWGERAEVSVTVPVFSRWGDFHATATATAVVEPRRRRGKCSNARDRCGAPDHDRLRGPPRAGVRGSP